MEVITLKDGLRKCSMSCPCLELLICPKREKNHPLDGKSSVVAHPRE